ncbi:MAG TPA: outer membrane beta-barrel family protein [Cyclobacteriaceae bacterium]|nr:outer membrane beta-barrel family protein [Cyclobacteriaceae bacterium]
MISALTSPFSRFLLVAAILFAIPAAAQVTIQGKVVDEAGAPMSFSNVAVYQQTDSTLASGAVTDANGIFKVGVKPGDYYIKVTFISFEDLTIPNIKASGTSVDVGSVVMKTSKSILDEVVVQGEKSSMELSLDKRVFNVGKDLANTGGTAADILSYVPSISVDPEGGIKLRGSDNVRILIDGKPSGLVSFNGSGGLQQLQGSMIERVEVITNPSARYEAEGMAGVINIVLKKDRKQGFNAAIDIITGYPVNMGAATNLNYRKNKVNFFINYTIAYRVQPARGTQYQERYSGDTTFYLRQSNEGTITGFNQNIRGGLDIFFTEKSVLTASYLFRRSDVKRLTDIVYRDFLFNESNPTDMITRHQDEDEIEPNSEYSLIYKKSFATKGHELIAEAKLLDNWETSDQTFTQNYFDANMVADPLQNLLQKSVNDESEKQLLFQLDYIKPIGKEGRFETGVRTSFRKMVNDYIVTQQQDDGSFQALPGLDNIFYYNENIHAAYAILGNKTGKVAYQAGLRAEMTDVKTTLEKTQEVNPRKYSNLFPSAHLTYDLPNDNDIQVSYSRRVRRPFYNDLSPFMTFSDSRNYFSGNPNLNPEFSDVFEIGHIKYFDKGSLTSSVYGRNTTSKIERIRTVDDKGNAITLPQNLRSEVAYGVEFTSTMTPVKWWKVDFNFNFFHADIDGSNVVSTYKASTYSWYARQSSRFTLPKSIDLQLRTNFEAPQKTAQGRRKALAYADFALSKEIFKGRGNLNFNVIDIFNSRRVRSITQGENFYTSGNFQGRKRQFNLTLSYRINQAKPAKARKLDEDGL